MLTKWKTMIKRELQLPSGNLNAYLLRNSSYYDNKGIKVFNSSAKGEEEYCGPCQLLRITSFALNAMKNPIAYSAISKFICEFI
jgi:hypothetical protein